MTTAPRTMVMAPSHRSPLRAALLAVLLLVTFAPRPASAAPTQEDVFKSIQSNVEGDTDVSTLIPFLLGLGGLVIVLAVAGNRRAKRPAGHKSLNHQGKLMREVLKSLPLRAKEVKQLKALAERAETEKPLASPLTLLLCPSVLARTIQATRPRTDRKVILSVARKAGLQVTRK